MTDQERKFYDYLMALPEDSFDSWLEKATQEQIDLADRLFDEVKLENFRFMDEVEDLSEAQTVLQQFTLKGKK
jgi:hypothetical protein